MRISGIERELSPIALGTADFGAGIARKTAFELMDEYTALGGNILDTASVYNNWVPGERNRSEKTIGAWLRASGMRDKMVLATKGAHYDLDTGARRLAPECITADAENSLECFGQGFIDLYYLHRDDENLPVGEIMDALFALQDRGLVGALGASNWSPARIDAAQAYARAKGRTGFDASQIQYALAMPASVSDDTLRLMDEREAAYYARAQMPVFAYTSQARGFFDKYPKGVAPKDYLTARNIARCNAAVKVASEMGASANAVALAALMRSPFPTVPVIGPRTLAQLRDSMSAARITLAEAQVKFIFKGIADTHGE